MLNKTAYIIKAPKVIPVPIGDDKTYYCEYTLHPRYTFLSVPLAHQDLEELYQNIQDLLYGTKVVA